MIRLLLSTCILAPLASSNALPRGIDIKNRHLYSEESGFFQCLKSGEKIPISDLNDDYCDCLDGSDEPGTSACAHLSQKPNTFTGFWCRNAGHIPETISPTLVDDGICDCCDGSDELFSGVKCTNICQEVGAVEREKRKQEFESANKGYEQRVEMAKKGQEEYNSAVNELKALEDEVAALNSKKDEANKIRDQLVAAEKVEKDRCIAIENERKAEVKREKTIIMQDNVFTILDIDSDGKITPNDLINFKVLNPEVSSEVEAMANDQGYMSLDRLPEFSLQISEALMQDSLSISKDQFFAEEIDEDSENPGHESLWDNISSFFDENGNWKSKYLDQSENIENSETAEFVSPEDLHKDEQDVDNDDHVSNYDDDDFNDDFDDEFDDDFDREDYDDDEYMNRKPPHSNNDKAEDSGYTMEIFDEIATFAIEKAREARSSSSDFDKQYRDRLNELNNKKGKHAISFGEDKSFSSLYEQCIEFRTNEYIYEVCLFKSASQKQLNGGGSTSLGKWQDGSSWQGEGFIEQKYFNGLKCWNGPDRSANVKFTCGTETKVIEVSEPQRCEYLFDVETPAVCEKMEDPSLHDEL